jgi:tRNA pseudouridine38-40 synthase
VPRYLLHLAFDGTEYCGWQIQPEVSSVQETIERALKIFVPDAGGIMGCGRTDTGVHASSFYAHFEAGNIDVDQVLYKLNAVLPKSIAIYSIKPVTDDFHARFSATSRTYEYYLHFRKNHFRNFYSTFHPKQLDLSAMNAACKHLYGVHDFSSFSKSKTQTKTNLCDVSHASWRPIEDGAIFEISANRFLRNMVRAIVGTMVEIGEGKMKPEHLKDVIAAQDRSAAGKSVRPEGLFLKEIIYPN